MKNLLSFPFFSLNKSVENGAERVSGKNLRCYDRGLHFSFLLKETMNPETPANPAFFKA